MITCLINGKERRIDQAGSLQDLLAELDINPQTVVVEHNESVVPRTRLSEAALRQGDKIEIVHFVGGGKDLKKASSKKPASKKKAGRSKAKHLVIVESPAKARTINKYLGNDYQVEASMGHVRDLPKSKMGVEVENDFEPKYVIMSDKRKTVTHLKKQAKGKDSVFLAPDPDREGEAISWHLAHIFNEADSELPVRRVVFHEITKNAILDAFKAPREVAMNLVNAQQARRILDRLVGYEISPLLWKKIRRGLSAGRVQSVALRLIVEREREIRNFKPVEYWTIEAKLSSEKPELQERAFIAKLDKIGKEKAELKKRDETEAIRQEILKLPFQVEKIEKKERSRKPQAPFTTSKLQQEAYTRLGFPAAKTMRIAQGLYEGKDIGEEASVGLITYMRTDSVNVSVQSQQEAAKWISEKHGKDYLPDKPPVYKSKKGAQEAHEAIRPTSAYREPEKMKSFLDDDEFKLYELIWRKFLASQMTPALDEHVAISILAGDKYHFRATGRRNLFPGFAILYDDKLQKASQAKKAGDDESEDIEGEFPPLELQEILKLHELLGYQHFTKPPARFNDASLVKALEEQGIGRPSTYAPTIYTILSRGYVSRRGGALQPTELGENVTDMLVKHFAKVMDVQFTANMEEELDKIEEGEMEWHAVLKQFYDSFQPDLEIARKEMKTLKREAVPTKYSCDVCGKQLVIKWGRFGKFLACSGFPECKYTRSIPTGFRCPESGCGGDLVKRMSKRRRIFYGCSNYPKCNYITNKLPGQEEKDKKKKEEEAAPDKEREVLGP